MLLEVSDLHVAYGAVEAVKDVEFSVGEGEIVAMIGPNGAGKSTCLKAVSGVLSYYNGHIVSGRIVFDGQNITGCASHDLAGLGIAVVPEGRRVFSSMTVRENLEMGAYSSGDRSRMLAGLENALKLFPQLEKLLHRRAGTLSGGEQQMLALGRAMMLQPKLLLADEPSLGLSPNFVEALFEKLIEIRESGVSVLLVEQNARMALQVADRAYVFEIARIRLDGSADELAGREDVQKAYFGE